VSTSIYGRCCRSWTRTPKSSPDGGAQRPDGC
jgi:hypothetical protein